MSVTKRTRLEVLRRDASTCQYCGHKAPDVEITIDHVVPVSLGGADTSDNLVAACRDCNAGKASINPDSPLVQQVSDHAAAYVFGLLDKMTRLRANLEREQEWVDQFEEKWSEWHIKTTGEVIALPPTWKQSVIRWKSMGIPDELFDKAINLAMNKDRLRGEFPEFAYMAGVIWRTVDQLEIDYSLQAEDAAYYTMADMRRACHKAFETGWDAGIADHIEHEHEHEPEPVTTKEASI